MHQKTKVKMYTFLNARRDINNFTYPQLYCHGAHTREEQEHADEDINSNIIFNKDIKAGHHRTR